MCPGTQTGETEAGITPPPLPSPAQQGSQVGGYLLPGSPGDLPQPAQGPGQEARLQSLRGVWLWEHSPLERDQGGHRTAGCEIHATEFKTFDCGALFLEPV